jgi:hypothetical protein
VNFREGVYSDKELEIKQHQITKISLLGTRYGTEFPCPAGTFSNRTGNVRWEVCEECPEGHYCPAETSVPKKCPRGLYFDGKGAKVWKISQMRGN